MKNSCSRGQGTGLNRLWINKGIPGSILSLVRGFFLGAVAKRARLFLLILLTAPYAARETAIFSAVSLRGVSQAPSTLPDKSPPRTDNFFREKYEKAGFRFSALQRSILFFLQEITLQKALIPFVGVSAVYHLQF